MPELVRITEKGGGDYTLRGDDTSWRATRWRPGLGRETLGSGDNLLDGPVRVIQAIVDHATMRYTETCRGCWGLDQIPPGSRRPGFRAGWAQTAASQERQAWIRQVAHWREIIEAFLDEAARRGWPTEKTLTLQWVDQTLQKDIPKWPSTASPTTSTTSAAASSSAPTSTPTSPSSSEKSTST